MQIKASYHLTAILDEAIRLKQIAEQFRSQLLEESNPKSEIDMYVEAAGSANSSTDFELKIAGMKVHAEFGLFTQEHGTEEKLCGRYQFRLIDAFGNVGAPFHALSFDKEGNTGLTKFASLMWTERMARSVRNAHLTEIAKAVIASLPNENILEL